MIELAKVAITCVAYQPDEEFLISTARVLASECLSVIIVNNSVSELSLSQDRANIVVLENRRNLGIAHAQNQAAGIAWEMGAEWIVQLDQDSCFTADTLRQLVSLWRQVEQSYGFLGVLSPRWIDRLTGVEVGNHFWNDHSRSDALFAEIPWAISSGSLISKTAFVSAGGMADDLFIDLVDTEFCFRVWESGFSVVQARDIVMRHTVGNGIRRVFPGIRVFSSPPERCYYRTRNSLWLMKQPYIPMAWKIRQWPKLLKEILYVLDGQKDRRARFVAFARGIIDGARKKLQC